MHPNVAERRRSSRIRLQVPLFLRSLSAAGDEFMELTKTLDISTTGACVASKRALEKDQLVRLTIPVSAEPISSVIPSATPPIQARVRRIAQFEDMLMIGVEFLTKLE